MNKKYGDIGFCIKSKKECKLKSCFRHICHNSNPLSITFADYEGSECCLKKEVEQNEKLELAHKYSKDQEIHDILKARLDKEVQE